MSKSHLFDLAKNGFPKPPNPVREALEALERTGDSQQLLITLHAIADRFDSDAQRLQRLEAAVKTLAAKVK